MFFLRIFLLWYFFSTMHIINKIKNIYIIIIIMSCGFVEMKILHGVGIIFLVWWKCGIFWKVKLSNFFQHQNKKKISYVGKVFFISNLKYFMYCGKLRENVENSFLIMNIICFLWKTLLKSEYLPPLRNFFIYDIVQILKNYLYLEGVHYKWLIR